MAEDSPTATPDAPAQEPAPIEGSPPETPSTETPTPSSPGGLMGKAAAEGDAPGTVTDPSKLPEPAPDTGNRPDYVPEQFWNAEKGEVNLEAAFKSYADIRNQNNKLLQDGPGSPLETPEEYLKDFVPPTKGRPGVKGEEGTPLDRFDEGLTAEDPAFVAASKAAQSAGLSKKQFDEFVFAYMENANALLPEPFNEQAELDKLGDSGHAIVKTNVQWINGLKRNGVINQDQYDLLLDFGSTALGVELVNALRTNSGEKPIPMGASVNNGAKTPDECAAMIADPRYHQQGAAGDAYRAEVEEQFIKTYGTGKQG